MSYRPALCALALCVAFIGCARDAAASLVVRDAGRDAAPVLAAGEVQNPIVLDSGPPPPMAADARLPAPREPPLVLFLLDSSASMEWKDNCTCSTPACSECMPDCAHGQRSRWLMLLEALTGSFADYACQLVPRTADNGASYDLGFSKPHAQLAASTTQRDDGVVDRFAARARFAFATFDSVRGDGDNSAAEVPLARFDQASSRSAAGMFSFGCGDDCPRRRDDGSIAGELYYPGLAEPYLIDTGIRSAAASEGALIVPRADEDAAALLPLAAAQLRAVRPFGGSPIAAAFDDLSIVLADPTLPEQRYVILISDGPADDDYRDFPVPGCACSTRQECGEDPAAMRCPYPTAREAAQRLHCDGTQAACLGASRVFVVALGAQDPATRAELDAIAADGGSDHAYSASGSVQLAAVLDSLLDTVTSP